MSITANRNLVFIYGENEYFCSRALAEIKKRYLEKYRDGLDLIEVDGENINLGNLAGQFQTLPMLTAKRLFIIRNLLSSKVEIPDSFADRISHLPDSLILVFYERGVPDQRKKAFKILSKTASVKKYDRLDDFKLKNWITKEVASWGGTIDTHATETLAMWFGNDLWMLKNEIDKLATFDKNITHETILELSTPKENTIVFALTDAIVAKDKSRALSLIDKLVTQGENEVRLLALIASAYRSLILIKIALEQKLTFSEIASQTKLHPYVVKKSFEITHKKILYELLADYNNLMALDFAIKTGKIESNTGLDLLVTRLGN